MASNTSRSMRASLDTGVVEGKYFFERPNTEVDAQNVTGDRLTRANRDALNPLDGYGAVDAPTKVSPSTWK